MLEQKISGIVMHNNNVPTYLTHNTISLITIGQNSLLCHKSQFNYP